MRETIDYLYNEPLINNRVAYSDEICFQPVEGRSQKLSINRTMYMFTLKKRHTLKREDNHIYLPALSFRESDFVMKMITVRTRVKNIDIFILKAMGEEPFRINGTYSYFAFLEKGDIVQVGYNKIIFQKKSCLKNNFIQIEENIITSKLPILLQGETGVGKSRLAKKIHDESGRVGDFVQLNINAFAETLVESEIFGHTKGAFTGAVCEKAGAFKRAQYGTLFLDEIDSLPMKLQTKLLIFLDNFTVKKVGGEKDEKLDVRLILSSGKPLDDLVLSGKMRKDFYYRIASGVIHCLPSLRDQSQNIENYCQQFCEDRSISICAKLLQLYKEFDWPGNYRQLKGHLEKKYTANGSKKLIYDKYDEKAFKHSNRFHNLGDNIISLKEAKERYCQKVYETLDRDIKDSSKALKISQNTLRSIVGTNRLNSE